MSDLILNHNFVRKLTRNIRDAYGKEVPHTKVLELIADAAGKKAGPMMHALKKVSPSEDVVADAPVKLSNKILSSELARSVLDALVVANGSVGSFDTGKDAMTIRLAFQLIDDEQPLGALLKGLMCLPLCAVGKNYFQQAFTGDRLTALLVGSALGDTGLNGEWLRAHYQRDVDYHIAAKILLKRELLMPAASDAVALGFIKFSGDQVVLS